MTDASCKNGLPPWSSDSIIHWLLEEGRFLSNMDEIVEQLGQKMLDSGAPLWRLRLAMRTLHPLTTAISAIWERNFEEAEVIESPHGLEGRPDYYGSPLDIISRTREVFRKRLSDELSDTDHEVLFEFKARGATDYFGIPLGFSSGAIAILVLVTDVNDGFTDHDIRQFHSIASVLAPVAEILNTTRISQAIADTYLGPRTGRLVLEGRITRGHIEKIDAAILVSDIRDWTGLNNRLSAEEALTLVNKYFEVISQSVENNGGEILKFIGDSVLAIFPSGGTEPGSDTACENALNAARQSLQKAISVVELSELEFGLGLHFGEVLYGNIGSATRLDFTVLGQAVNIAARIEGQCATLKQRLLFSEDFASRISEPKQTVTKTRLKGLNKAIKILTIPF